MSALGVIWFALVIVAGALAIPGWLLNERDRERRYSCRMFAWMALLGAFGLNWAENMDRHRWGWALLGAVNIVIAMWRVKRWWRAVEAMREVKRVLARRPEWLR